ncbi:PAS domain-containing sensor histidine kinase [Usitatibacter palustris]|nr:PAS domain-containing sensor histidine kinase [Usitatibacter palustris]
MQKANGMPAASEAMVRGILDSLDSRIAVLDGQGRIVAVNPAWERFDDVRIAKGFAPAHVGDNYLELLDDLARAGQPGFPEAASAARRMIAREAPFAAVDYRIDAPGGVRWFVARITPMEGMGGAVVVAHEDVTARVLAREAVDDANRRLKALSGKVLSIQEEERRALSRELHDDVGQSLAALGIALHRTALGKPGGLGQEQCARLVEEVFAKIRTMSQELRPPQLEQLGLSDALRWLAKRHSEATGVRIACDFAHAGTERVSPDAEITCYRIAQEAISNATRHARPRSIALALRRTKGLLELVVSDDGAGFDMSAVRARGLQGASLGLTGMEERAELVGGRVEFKSAAGEGTTVTARFPLEAA